MIAHDPLADACMCATCLDDGPYVVIGKASDPRLRRGDTIGASDAPRLLGLDPNISSRAAFDAFVRRESTPPNPYTQAGQYLEEGVMRWAGDRAGVTMRPWQDRLRAKHEPWLTATPDGEIIDSDGKRRGLVEIKCTGIGQRRDHWQSGPPDKVLAQVQLQLHVTGRSDCAVVQWSWGEWPTIYRVERDEKMIRVLLTRLEDIWRDVQGRRKDLGLE